jgi:hypothetical protein
MLRFDCASSTILNNFAIAELFVVAVVLILNGVAPELIVPPETLLPGPFFTSLLSPVKFDSSTVDSPSTTIQSAGILSPVRTKTMDPTLIVVAGNTTISLVTGFTRCASSGRTLTIVERAFLARIIANDSSHSLITKRNVKTAASTYS